MTEETIVQDVSDAGNPIEGEGSEQQPEVTIPDNPIARREAKMKDLYEKRVEEREADRKSAALINNPDLTEEEYENAQPSGNEAIEPAGEGEQSPVAEDGDNSQPLIEAGEESNPKELPPAALNGWRENDAGQTVRQLSVNGRMVEVTQEQYERYAQKDMAGDEKLNRAAAIEKVLGQREKSILERERAFDQRSQPPQGVDRAGINELFAEFQEAITEGDLDVSNEKFQDYIDARLERLNQPTLSMDEVVSQATTQIERNAVQKAVADDVNTGYADFQEQYADVFADEDALAFADMQITKLRKSNPEMPFSARALEAGRITRERLGLSGGARVPTGNTGEEIRAERHGRKANLRPIPGTGKAHKVKEKPQQDLSPKANIQRMRAGRAR